MRHFAYIRLRFPIVKSEVFRLFSWRWTRVFVPLPDSFPPRWTAGKQAILLVFTAWLTPWKQIVFRRFPVTKQRVNWCSREFSLIYLMFTARLTHGIQVVFRCFLVFPSYKTTHSLEFSVTFLAFSRTVNEHKMPENCLFFSVHQLVNTWKTCCFLWR